MDHQIEHLTETEMKTQLMEEAGQDQEAAVNGAVRVQIRGMEAGVEATWGGTVTTWRMDQLAASGNRTLRHDLPLKDTADGQKHMCCHTRGSAAREQAE